MKIYKKDIELHDHFNAFTVDIWLTGNQLRPGMSFCQFLFIEFYTRSFIREDSFGTTPHDIYSKKYFGKNISGIF